MIDKETVVEPETELEWMLQNAQVTDADLFEALFTRYSVDLYSFSLFSTGSHIQAGEFTFQTVESTVDQRHRYTGEYSLKTWVLAASYQMSRRRRWPFLSRRGIHYSCPPGTPAQDGKAGEIWKAAGEINNQYVLILRYVYSLPISETAFVLAIKESKANTCLEKAWDLLLHNNDIWQRFLNQTAHSSGEVSQLLLKLKEKTSHPHAYIRHLIKFEFWQGRRPDLQLDVQAHLQECEECQAYMTALQRFNSWLTQVVQEDWASLFRSPVQLEGDVGGQARLSSFESSGQAARRKKLGFSVKEVALSLAVITILFTLAWFGDVFAVEPTPTQVILEGFRPSNTATPPPARHLRPSNSQLFEATGPTATPRSSASRQPQYIQPDQGHSIVRLRGYTFLDFTWAANQLSKRNLPDGWRPTIALNLALVLWFWGENYEPDTFVEWVQPVMEKEMSTLEEMSAYVKEKTGLRAAYSKGGTLGQLKNLVAEGFPVIIHTCEAASGQDDSCRIETVYGYDDFQKEIMLLAPTLKSRKLVTSSYADLEESWRNSNSSFLLVYQAGDEARLKGILKSLADSSLNGMFYNRSKSLNNSFVHED